MLGQKQTKTSLEEYAPPRGHSGFSDNPSEDQLIIQNYTTSKETVHLKQESANITKNRSDFLRISDN